MPQPQVRQTYRSVGEQRGIRPLRTTPPASAERATGSDGIRQGSGEARGVGRPTGEPGRESWIASPPHLPRHSRRLPTRADSCKVPSTLIRSSLAGSRRARTLGICGSSHKPPGSPLSKCALPRAAVDPLAVFLDLDGTSLDDRWYPSDPVESEVEFRPASAIGVVLRAVHCCPYRREEGCECVQPKPHFARLAEQEYDLDLHLRRHDGDPP
jgi:hypothetical protein